MLEPVAVGTPLAEAPLQTTELLNVGEAVMSYKVDGQGIKRANASQGHGMPVGLRRCLRCYCWRWWWRCCYCRCTFPVLMPCGLWQFCRISRTCCGSNRNDTTSAATGFETTCMYQMKCGSATSVSQISQRGINHLDRRRAKHKMYKRPLYSTPTLMLREVINPYFASCIFPTNNAQGLARP